MSNSLRVGEHRPRRGSPTCRSSPPCRRPRSAAPPSSVSAGRGAAEVVQRVGPAQDLLDRARDERRVGAQRRRAARGAASSASRPDDSIVRVVSLPAVTSCTKKLPNSMSVIGWPSTSIASTSVVRSSAGSAAPLAPRARSRTSPSRSLALIAASAASAGDVGVLAAGVHLRPAVDPRPVLARDAHELADDLRRQLGAHVVDEVDVAVSRGVVEDRRGRSRGSAARAAPSPGP